MNLGREKKLVRWLSHCFFGAKNICLHHFNTIFTLLLRYKNVDMEYAITWTHQKKKKNQNLAKISLTIVLFQFRGRTPPVKLTALHHKTRNNDWTLILFSEESLWVQYEIYHQQAPCRTLKLSCTAQCSHFQLQREKELNYYYKGGTLRRNLFFILCLE